MYQAILLIHVFTAVCIIALVLVQQGKGATLGAAFGSGASQTVFGSRGSGSFLFRITISFVAIFFITSLTMNYLVMKTYKQEKVMTLLLLPQQSRPLPSSADTDLQVPAMTSSLQGPAKNETNLPANIPTR